MVFMHEFGNDKAFNEGRSVALSIPFSQRVWKTERYYCWHASCPGEFSNSLLKYVTERFSKVSGKLFVFSIDSETENEGIIPYALFNDRNGVWDYEPKVALSVLKK